MRLQSQCLLLCILLLTHCVETQMINISNSALPSQPPSSPPATLSQHTRSPHQPLCSCSSPFFCWFKLKLNNLLAFYLKNNHLSFTICTSVSPNSTRVIILRLYVSVCCVCVLFSFNIFFFDNFYHNSDIAFYE